MHRITGEYLTDQPTTAPTCPKQSWGNIKNEQRYDCICVLLCKQLIDVILMQ